MCILWVARLTGQNSWLCWISLVNDMRMMNWARELMRPSWIQSWFDSKRKRKKAVAPRKVSFLKRSIRTSWLLESAAHDECPRSETYGWKYRFRDLQGYDLLSVLLPGLWGDKADRLDVIKGDSTNSKAALEALVHKHGGDFTQAQLSDNTAMVIAPDEKGTAVNCDWLNTSWISRSKM